MTSIWFPTISGLNVVPPYATPGTLLSYTTILNASDSWGSNSGIYPSGDDLYVRSRGNSSAQIVAAVLGGSLTVGHTLKIVDGAGVTWLISSPVVLGGTISGIIVNCKRNCIHPSVWMRASSRLVTHVMRWKWKPARSSISRLGGLVG